MFGYVRPLKANLTGEQGARYDAVYCGLCHAMGKRYGLLSRFTLTYDFAFLAMVLAPQEGCPAICQKRCPAHPFRRKKGCISFEGLDVAADESVILTWHKLRDDVRDKGFLAGIPAQVASLGLYRAYRKAAALQSEFDQTVKDCLAELHQMEEERSGSIDRVADTFARILEAAAPKSNDIARDRIVKQLLYHVGRWIYLIDAWDDLTEDRKQRSYNPLDIRFENAPEAHTDELRITMTHSLRLAVSAYQLADFGAFQAIIENILYLGLPTVQEAVLAGKWHEMQKNGRKKHE